MSIPTPIVPPPSDNWPGAWQGPPAAMLAYSSIQGRPGLVTGLGVTSIVIASLSILGAMWWGLMYLPWIIMSTQSFAVAGGPAATAAVTTPAGSLTQEQAELIAAALASRQPLTTQDQTALAQGLMLAESPLTPPLDGEWTAEHVKQQIGYVSSWSDNTSSSVDFNFNSGGDISISGGTVTISIYNGNGFSSTTVSSGAVASSTANAFGPQTAFTGPGKGVIGLGLGSLLLSLGLAVLLLIAGIQTVRGLPSGRLLHLCWAWPKLAAAVLAAVANYWFWRDSFYGFGGAPGMGGVLLGMTGGMFALAIGWPIAVLLILRSRSLRAYYRADAMS